MFYHGCVDMGGHTTPDRTALHRTAPHCTPSHRITAINVRVDAATKEELEMDLTWMLHRPYAFLPPEKYCDHCQLEQLAVPARVQYEHRWGPNYRRGLGPPLDWFTSAQQRHLAAHWMQNLPNMPVLAKRTERACSVCYAGAARHL